MTAPAVAVCTLRGADAAVPDDVEEVLTLARTLSTALGAELTWLVVGAAPDESVRESATRHGVARIDWMEDARLDEFQPDAYVEALAQYCSQRTLSALLFSQTYDVRLVAPRLAGRTGAPVVMNAVGVDLDDERQLQVTASAYGGDTRIVYQVNGDGPAIIAVMPNAVAAEPAEAETAPAMERVAVDLSSVEERVRVVEAAKAEGPRLEDAQVIVAGGRGLGGPEHFALVEELAEALGGMAGASRPIVDDGWTDASRQVGLTGKVARPALYIAAGISGASQHMAGCSAAKTIVAINRDPDAAIFRYARYGIVGDCLEILPELTRAVKASGK